MRTKAACSKPEQAAVFSLLFSLRWNQTPFPGSDHGSDFARQELPGQGAGDPLRVQGSGLAAGGNQRSFLCSFKNTSKSLTSVPPSIHMMMQFGTIIRALSTSETFQASSKAEMQPTKAMTENSTR